MALWVLHASIQVLLYGLLAGLSPLGFAATLAVMPAGRLKTAGFSAGFVTAQTLTCSVLVIIGIAATGSSTKSHPKSRAGLEIALALALISIALRLHRRDPNTNSSPTTKWSVDARMQALVERLRRMRFVTTAVAGFVLGIGGPKRLVVTSLAASTIVATGRGSSAEAVLVVVYVTLATALVWVPAILFVLLGRRAIALMQDAQGKVSDRQPQITVYTLLVLAAFLAIDAVAELVT